MREKLDALYPSADWHLNHRLCVLLIYLQSPSVIAKTLELLAHADRPEDFMQYLFFLRYVREGWTLAQRQAYFRALERAEHKQGARDYYSVLKRVRDEVTAQLTLAERDALKPVLAGAGQTLARVTNSLPSQLVREWRMEDFDLRQPARGRSFAGGKSAFTKAQCILCHRCGSPSPLNGPSPRRSGQEAALSQTGFGHAGGERAGLPAKGLATAGVRGETGIEGGIIGPDLSAVGSRFDRRAILESILEPSKVIDEKYRNTVFTLRDGTSVIGAIEREDEQNILVRESPFGGEPTQILKQNVARREASAISPMPAGLVNVLTQEEILDLLAFLLSGGNPADSAFSGP